MAKLMPISKFVSEIYAAYKRKDGYLMGATGQDPKKWSVNSWWFTQYSGKQREKALYWRSHAARVWDCCGLSEGLYKDYTGVDINTKARYNYAQWCSPKGSGSIPLQYRVPGTAVFWGTSAANIHHVGYLYAPVKAGHPEGDWYIIEARGVNYGVVMTKLNSRKPNYWGLMTKYFDYGKNQTETSTPVTPQTPTIFTLGDRTLQKGTKGEDVKELQKALLSLGYTLPKYGADGDFGSETERAVKLFQTANGLVADGVVDKEEIAKLKPAVQFIIVTGALVNLRADSNTSSKIVAIVTKNTVLEYLNDKSDNGWYKVKYKDKVCWISGKYSEPK